MCKSMGTLREGTAVTSAADLKRRSHSPQALDMGLYAWKVGGYFPNPYSCQIYSSFTLGVECVTELVMFASPMVICSLCSLKPYGIITLSTRIHGVKSTGMCSAEPDSWKVVLTSSCSQLMYKLHGA